LERQDDDLLTAEEADELEQMRQVNRMVSALRSRALASGSSRHDKIPEPLREQIRQRAGGLAPVRTPIEELAGYDKPLFKPGVYSSIPLRPFLISFFILCSFCKLVVCSQQ